MYIPETSLGLSQIQISRAIGLARILLIIGLVLLHYGTFPNSTTSPFEGIDIHEHRFATWVNSAILFFFFCSVPLLSLISGWLFFSFPPDEAKAALRKRIGRRFQSLYVPLIVWNLAYLVLLYTIFLIHPQASMFTHLNRLHMDFNTAGWKEYANAVFAIYKEPIAFQFWFVRDLFITILVSPLFWLVLRHMAWPGAVVLCLLWLGGWNMGIFTRLDVPFFFYMGALIQQKHMPLTVSLPVTVGLLTLFIILAGLRALAPFIIPISDNHPLWIDIATRSMRMVGVIGCWGALYRLAQTDWGTNISTYGGLAFFLHSVHWPLLAVVKAGVSRLIAVDDDLTMLVHYALSVLLTIMIGLAVGLIFAHRMPKIFAWMNGGRMLGKSIGRTSAEPPPSLAQVNA